MKRERFQIKGWMWNNGEKSPGYGFKGPANAYAVPTGPTGTKQEEK